VGRMMTKVNRILFVAGLVLGAVLMFSVMMLCQSQPRHFLLDTTQLAVVLGPRAAKAKLHSADMKKLERHFNTFRKSHPENLLIEKGRVIAKGANVQLYDVTDTFAKVIGANSD